MQQWAADHDTYMKITKQWIYLIYVTYENILLPTYNNYYMLKLNSTSTVVLRHKTIGHVISLGLYLLPLICFLSSFMGTNIFNMLSFLFYRHKR